MNAFRTNRLLRLIVVIVAAVAWFTLANHCALRGMWTAGMKSQHGCCQKAPAHPPAKGETGMVCCDSVQATAPDVSGPAQMPPVLEEAWMVVVAMVFWPADGASAGEREAGPPRGWTFAELVLNRSLLAHAPPRLA